MNDSEISINQGLSTLDDISESHVSMIQNTHKHNTKKEKQEKSLQ